MNPFVYLGLIAEIAATYLGFIAVFIVFSRDDGRFAESDKHFVQGLVITSTSVIAFALMPRVLVQFVAEQEAWSLSLNVVIGLGSLITVFQAWSQFMMAEEEAKKVHWSWHAPGWILALLGVGLFFAGYMNLLAQPGAFLAGLTCILAVAIWCFIAIVFRKFF